MALTVPFLWILEFDYNVYPKSTYVAPMSSLHNFESYSSRLSNFQLGLIYSSVFVDFAGTTIFLNVVPILVDVNYPEHLKGIPYQSPGTAFSLLNVAFAGGMLISPLIFGFLSDQIGRRPLLLASLAGPALGYLWQACTNQFWSFFAARLVCGLTSGGRPVAIALISDSLAGKQKKEALALVNFAPALAMALCPAIGGILGSISVHLPSQLAFVSAAVLAVLVFFYVDETSPKSCSSFSVYKAADYQASTFTLSTTLLLSFVIVVSGVLPLQQNPLILKEEFGLSASYAGTCSIGDGAASLVANFVFSALISRDVCASYIGFFSSFLFLVAFFLPLAFAVLESLPVYLLLKYTISMALPLTFNAIPQVLSEITPATRSGEFMGYMALFQGLARLLVTGAAGLMFDWSPAYGPFLSGVCGGLSILFFLPLIHEMQTGHLRRPLPSIAEIPEFDEVPSRMVTPSIFVRTPSQSVFQPLLTPERGVSSLPSCHVSPANSALTEATDCGYWGAGRKTVFRGF